MKKIFATFIITSITLATTLGNVGVFLGAGRTVYLDSSAEIQMVEEEIIMIPSRGAYPIDTSARNLDQMRYRCTFKLRNLANASVSVQVGFPLSSDAIWFRDRDKINQAKIIGEFGFVAGTKDEIFPVRYIQNDERKNFGNLFLWDMTFAPNEEITLYVNYTMGGYYGIATTDKNFGKKRIHPKYNYLKTLCFGIGQGHNYITATGGSWAGKIEKAVFKLYCFEFEKYLQLRGAWEETNKTKRPRSEKQRESDFIRQDSPLVHNWMPERNLWTEKSEINGQIRYLELVYEPFEPQKGDDIFVGYIFPSIPTDVETFERFVAYSRKKLEQDLANREQRLASLAKNDNDKNTKYNEQQKEYLLGLEELLLQFEKNIADVILEFHGISTDNDEIKDFLTLQCWYPLNEPRPIDPKLKARLKQSSGMISPISD